MSQRAPGAPRSVSCVSLLKQVRNARESMLSASRLLESLEKSLSSCSCVPIEMDRRAFAAFRNIEQDAHTMEHSVHYYASPLIFQLKARATSAFQRIPDDVIAIIFSLCTNRTLAALSLVSKKYRDLTLRNPTLWGRRFEEEYRLNYNPERYPGLSPMLHYRRGPLPSSEWVSMPPMRECRTLFAAVAVRGCVFAIGGFNGEEPLSSMEGCVLEPGRRPDDVTWVPLPSMATPRYGHSAVYVPPPYGGPKGSIHVTGGRSTPLSRLPLNSTEIFSFATHTWSLGPNLIHPHECHTSHLITHPDGHPRLYVIAGGHRHCEVLDLQGGGHFQLLPEILTPRQSHASVAYEGKIVVFGGFRDRRESVIYDVERKDWRMGPPMRNTAKLMGCVRVGACVFVMGGYQSEVTAKGVLRYSLTHNTWTPVASLMQPRLAPQSVRVPGMLLALGGEIPAPRGSFGYNASNRVERINFDYCDEEGEGFAQDGDPVKGLIQSWEMH